MRLLVVGTGSIGLRHCKNLAAMGHEVLAWDTDAGRLREAGAIAGVSAAPGLEGGLARRPDAVLVCTPPASHVAIARMAIEADAHVFVEKPIAAASDEVPDLLDEAKRRARLVAVGFNLRFLPSLREVKALLDSGRVGRVLSARAEFGFYLPAWRPRRDYRDNYAVRREEGGGILLDAIHELDYLGWLLGDVAEVFCACDHVSDLAGDTEDLAEIMLRFASGALGQVHLDYFRRAYRRTLEVIGAEGVIEWDYARRTVSIRGPAPDSVETHAHGGPPEAMYVEELCHFIRCLKDGAEPMVSGREGLRSLRVVEAAKRSSAERRWVSL
jgi:predicted dehydrogenase